MKKNNKYDLSKVTEVVNKNVIYDKIADIVNRVISEIQYSNEHEEYYLTNDIKFVIYKDNEIDDLYAVYTYYKGELQEDLDTGDVHISDLDTRLLKIADALLNLNEAKQIKFAGKDNYTAYIVDKGFNLDNLPDDVEYTLVYNLPKTGTKMFCTTRPLTDEERKEFNIRLNSEEVTPEEMKELFSENVYIDNELDTLADDFVANGDYTVDDMIEEYKDKYSIEEIKRAWDKASKKHKVEWEEFYKKRNIKNEAYFVCGRCGRGIDLDYHAEDYVVDPNTNEDMCLNCAIEAGIPVDGDEDIDVIDTFEHNCEAYKDFLDDTEKYIEEWEDPEAYMTLKDMGNQVSKELANIGFEMGFATNTFTKTTDFNVARAEMIDMIKHNIDDSELEGTTVKDIINKINSIMNIKTESINTKNDSVIVISYGRGMRFPDRKTAIDYYKECIEGTDPDGAENYAYQNILYELIHTNKDVVYDTDDETEYDWWVQKGKPTDDVSDELLKAHGAYKED